MSVLGERVRRGFAHARWRELRVAAHDCPFCGSSVLIRLRADETGVRCLRCAASAVHIAIGHVLRDRVPDLAARDVCELSTRGALAAFLRRSARSVALSEYIEGTAPGSERAGIRCEDVQALRYASGSFDLVTHTEVLEHVPDDARAFAELHRVLRPGGAMLFTVPLSAQPHTLERARLRNGVIEHLCEPEYHVDPFRDGARILAWRDYGTDILDRLRVAGFAEVALRTPRQRIPWSVPRAIICAHKA